MEKIGATADQLAVSDFPQPKRASLAESIADAIAEAVATRHLAPGERVVETALAKRYVVSRVPVREALKILHTQGILTGGGHRGYRVAEFTPERVNQVFEIRLMLEAILLRDAVTRWHREDADLTELQAIVETMRTAAKSEDFRSILRQDLEFHRTICAASENEVARSMWNAIARHVLIIFNLARYRDTGLSVVVRRHEKLLAFIRGQVQAPGSVDTLRAALDDHFLPRRKNASDALRDNGAGRKATVKLS